MNGRKTPISYAVGIISRKAPQEMVFNGLRFSDIDEAIKYGEDLMVRWPDVLTYKVEAKFELSNCKLPIPSDRYLIARK